MTLRPIGPRVLVRPIEQPASAILELTDDQAPQQAEVVTIGAPHCPECRSVLQVHLSPGMRVALRPTAYVQDVTVNGETFWLVGLDDVIAEVLPVEV